MWVLWIPVVPVLLITILIPQAQAQANEKATYEGRHFIKIATHGAPLWNATAYLRSFDTKTKTIKTWYRWHRGTPCSPIAPRTSPAIGHVVALGDRAVRARRAWVIACGWRRGPPDRG